MIRFAIVQAIEYFTGFGLIIERIKLAIFFEIRNKIREAHGYLLLIRTKFCLPKQIEQVLLACLLYYKENSQDRKLFSILIKNIYKYIQFQRNPATFSCSYSMSSNKRYNITSRNRACKVNGKYPKIYTINRNDEKQLNPKEVKSLANKSSNLFEKKKHRKHSTMIIRGVNDLGYQTIKSNNVSIAHMLDDEEDYYRDKVKSDTNFQKYYTIELIVY